MAFGNVWRYFLSPGTRVSNAGQNWGGGVLLAICLGIAVLVTYAFCLPFPCQSFGILLLIAGAACAVGVFAGFLFGIPRTLQREAVPATATREARLDRDALGVNTNLEQISDWLTKIIVGVGLVQLSTLDAKIRELTDFLATSFDGAAVPSPVIGSILFYFGILSFLLGYLWTRLILANEFDRALRIVRERPEYYEGVIHGLLYQPKPTGFELAIEQAEEYNRRFPPNNARVWTYLACAYGQKYDYLGRAPKPDQNARKEARDKALEAIDRALQINPDLKDFLAGLWDEKAIPGEDDLTAFKDDEEFKQRLGTTKP